MHDGSINPAAWPDLASPARAETAKTLLLWSQVVGKTRLALAPMINHWWQVPLYVSARGLTTSLIPLEGRAFEVELDLLSHRLELRVSDGQRRSFALGPGTLADFYARYFHALRAVDIDVSISPLAVEIAETIHLDTDTQPRAYDRAWVSRLHGALVEIDTVMKQFRGAFLGKVSPVHLFWGSFDLAVTRFSGNRAPLHPGGVPHCPDYVMQEAYSHEVSSAGFWPGSAAFPEPAFYSYAYPEPEGFAEAEAHPGAARYDPSMKEFVLPYEAVRTARIPGLELLMFFQSTYLAAAELGHWDRAALERPAQPAHRLRSPMDYECEHLESAAERAHGVEPSGEGCRECLESGDEWVHLRLCLSCGHVGCCDDSKGRHATRHHGATGHPVIRSFEPGEQWAYCYDDDAFAEVLAARDHEAAPVHYSAP